ncbi:nose resistant to fluoxetine protein 6-like [Ischnura elegans]|uniref:nose resistant to fluoxetine protein 6-like n=1 Tax=Ischnura elegans TaxID=197161 RepID=UPI001ED88C80|nr:nose resistant to fluoxetine protein 6-like [Ischnura elegans]
MDRFVWALWCVLLCALLARGCLAEEVHTKGIDHLLDVWNLRRLHSRIKEGRWKSYGVELEGDALPCVEDVSRFLEALRRGVAWADMVYDSSGRYSSQFLFGNDYWLGSTTQCQGLDKAAMAAERSRLEAGSPVEGEGTAETSGRVTPADPFAKSVAKRENDPQRSAAVTSDLPLDGKVPPYRLRFFVVTVEVELPAELSPKARPLRLGVCMPRSCSTSAVSSLMALSAADRDGVTLAVPKGSPVHRGRSVKVLRVRPVPGDYEWSKDPKTFIIAGATIFVFILMALAEVCEQYSKHRSKRLSEEYSMAKMKMKDVEVGKNNNDGEAMQMREYHVAKKEPSPGTVQRLLLCFSIRRNGKKILCGTEDGGKDDERNLDCIHGLRVISMGWVILVHTYLMVFAIAENKNLRNVKEKNYTFQTVLNATFSVDTFFLISGILVAYLYFRARSKDKNAKREAARGCEEAVKETNPSAIKMNLASCPKNAGAAFLRDFSVFVKLLGYRFLRLTPPYLWTIGIAEVGMRYTLNLSLFETKIVDHITCAKYWWRNVLYINSLYPREEMCMIWSWYMANDTQFYALGIILLLLSARYFRFAAIAGVLFMVSSWVTTAAISVHYDYHVSIQDPFALFDQLYDKPWLRLGPYLVGMLTGWILYKTALNIRMPKVAVITGWILSLVCMALLIYGVSVLGDYVSPTGSVGLGLTTSAIYTSLGHTAWAVAVAWVVVACCTGHGGWVSGLLSWSALRPFSRLTYCAFLIHPLVMMISGFRMQAPLHLEPTVVIMIYLGYMLASFAAAFFVSICFEAPAVSLLKMAFKMPKSKTNEPSSPKKQ